MACEGRRGLTPALRHIGAWIGFGRPADRRRKFVATGGEGAIPANLGFREGCQESTADQQGEIDLDSRSSLRNLDIWLRISWSREGVCQEKGSYGPKAIILPCSDSFAAARRATFLNVRPNLTGNPLLNLGQSMLDPSQRRIAPLMRAAVMRRDNYTCWYCGAPADEVDHVEPWVQGGLTVMANLVAACQPCNRAKGDRTPAEWAAAKHRKATQMVKLRKARQIPLRKARRIRGRVPAPTLVEILRSSGPLE